MDFCFNNEVIAVTFDQDWLFSYFQFCIIKDKLVIIVVLKQDEAVLGYFRLAVEYMEETGELSALITP